MRRSMMSATVLAAVVGLVACGASNNAQDMNGGNHDMAMPGGNDMAMPIRDMAMSMADLSGTGGDMAGDGGAGCTVIAAWPGLNLAGGAVNGTFPFTYVLSTDPASPPYGALEIDDYHTGGETFPNVVTLDPTTSFANCTACVYFNDACADQQTCFNNLDYSFFGQGGTVTINQADTNESTGRMTASFSNLKLVEYDFFGDQPVPGGRCFLINSGSLDVMWNNPTDGGTTDDGGTPPSSSSLWFQGDFLTNNIDQLGFSSSALGKVTTALGNQIKSFDVTPDGQHVVVAADAAMTGRFDLYIANPDGTGSTQLVQMMNATANVRDIKISPDGTKVAFIGDYLTAGLNDVWLVPYTTTGTPVTPTKISPARMTANDNTLQPGQIAWSRDSKFVSISGDYHINNKNELFITDTTAGSPTPVTAISTTTIGTATGVQTNQAPPVWTSGGRLLFKATLMGDAAPKLYGSDSNGTNVAVLGNFPAPPVQLGTFGMSPNGATIAIAVDSVAAANAYEVYVMPSDGSAAPTLRSSGTLPAPAAGSRGPDFFQPLYWSPDGNKIAYAADILVDNRFETYVTNASGATGETHLAIVGTAGDAARDVNMIAWAPDSSTLAILADHRADNDFEVFTLADVTTADQTPTLLQGVPPAGGVPANGGDVNVIRWTRP
jgi:Tol biopolymer transport system component